jgi:uncharacterized delta-60 repeat protein
LWIWLADDGIYSGGTGIVVLAIITHYMLGRYGRHMPGPGDIDTSFGGNGKKTITFGGVDEAHAVLVQPNARIVVAGGGGAAASTFCVARLRPDGKLDTTFGPAGKRRIAFGGDQEAAFGAALQPDGKIVLTGDSDFRVAVARLNPDGTLDATFSGDGKRTFSWGPISRAQAAVVMPNGKLLLAGFSGPETGNVQVARLKPNGALDGTFGVGGIAKVDFGGDDFGLAMARQANGRIIVVGRSLPTFPQDETLGAIVTRVRSNGELDPDFAGTGKITLPGTSNVRAVLVQPDRKIVVAGTADGSQKMTVTRLRPNGALDPTFDGDGTATIDFAAVLVTGAALQPDGKIVVSGSSAGRFAVARLNPDGSPDATFGTTGKATVDFGVPTFAHAVARQPNGRIVIAGQRTVSDDFALARLLA